MGVRNIWRFILTHPDMDHMDGLNQLYRNFEVSFFWDTENRKKMGDFDGSRYKKEDWDRYQEIRKNADRMLAMIDDTLRLSDLDSQNSEVEFAEVDLYEAAKECMEGLSVYAKQRDVSLQLEGKSQIVWANKDMIKELVENQKVLTKKDYIINILQII